jgi:hypothetical protein
MSYQRFKFLVSLATAQGIKTVGDFEKFVADYSQTNIK